ncbi:MAG: tetratricopeptide repeat protein [Candidatus Omnitrophota bacterium]
MQNDSHVLPRTSFWQKVWLIFFGVALSLVLLEVGLRLGGVVVLALQDCRNSFSLRFGGTYKILCLGESTTQGQYPGFLEEALNRRDVKARFSVIDKGRAGTNSSLILGNVEVYLNTYHPDMVVVMMGINDLGAHMPYDDAASLMPFRFLKFLKVYKLTQLLSLHMAHKVQAVDWECALKSKKVGDQVYSNLGRSYRKQGEFLLAEECFKKALELNPKNDGAWVGLGWFRRRQGQFLQAEEYFEKALELNPRNDMAYYELGRLFREEGVRSRVQKSFMKALTFNPKNDGAYYELGRCYLEQGNFKQVEKLFKKALALNSSNKDAHINLGWFYYEQGRFSLAKESFEKGVALDPANERLYYGALAVLYGAVGQRVQAQENYDKANNLGMSWYRSMTVDNYHALKEVCDRRKVRLVCVQYPMRSIEPLKRIFKGDSGGIIFVDNERSFKEGVSKSTYKAYFTDMFGGEFGHCTAKGNRLVAENIANEIFKEAFHQ